MWRRGSRKMKSYASIDRIEGDIAVCEVEMISYRNSKPEDFFDKETTMIDIPMDEITKVVGDVKEGDILIIRHQNETFVEVLRKDDEEKQRRINLLLI